MSGLPLDGVRVLDLSRQLPGPLATQILADFGAEVIKVEDTRSGDNFRHAEPKLNGVSARHLQLNRNKRGLAVDLKAPDGRELFLALAERSQVVFEQFRPGVAQRLGIDYEAVRRRNPAVVYCSLSGSGQDSPYRTLAAHDPNYLSLAGVLSLVGRRGDGPVLAGPQLADISAAHLSAIGILMALRRAEATGHGDYIDISLFDSAFSLPLTALSSYLAGGAVPARGGERHNGRYPWADIYRTADDGWITLCAIEEHFYANLCRALGREDWLGDQYADDARQEEIRAGMAAIFATRSRDEWFALLKDKDVCIAPVLAIDEAAQSEQVRARGSIVEHRHPVAGETRLLRSPIRMASVQAGVRRGAPGLGEHTAEILSEAGYAQADIERLVQAGVVAAPRQPPE